MGAWIKCISARNGDQTRQLTFSVQAHVGGPTPVGRLGVFCVWSAGLINKPLDGTESVYANGGFIL